MMLSGCCLALTMSTSFAANTSADAKWNCTTNASSAGTDAEKTADDQMAKLYGEGSMVFGKAKENCRDCTKITCVVQQ